MQAKQHGEGMVESAKGNMRETYGNVTGDKSQQAKGKLLLRQLQIWALPWPQIFNVFDCSV